MFELKWKSYAAGGKVSHVACHRLTSRRRVGLHNHDFAEFIWGIAGHGWHGVNGEKVRIEPGILSMIRPTDCHELWLARGDFFDFYVVSFPIDALSDFDARYSAEAVARIWDGNAELPMHLRLSRDQQQQMQKNVSQLALQKTSRFALDLFLMNTFSLVTDTGENSCFADCPEWLRRAISVMRESGDFSHGSKQIAVNAGRSPEHVARTLKTSTGKTPSEVVNRVRLEYAANLLLTTTQDIHEIAFDCGFNSMGYFYQVFKTCYGTSPLKYRRQNLLAIERRPQ